MLYVIVQKLRYRNYRNYIVPLLPRGVEAFSPMGSTQEENKGKIRKGTQEGNSRGEIRRGMEGTQEYTFEFSETFGGIILK